MNIISIAAAACAVSLALSAASPVVKPATAQLGKVMHAGGAVMIDGECVRGSNSFEGLVRCAESGESAVELDFIFTSDGRLVCAHDWEGRKSIPEYEEFMTEVVSSRLTPLDAEAVVRFMRENEEITLVTDIKDERFEEALAALSDAAGEIKERVVVQIYSEEQLVTARACGFERVIYTLYRLTWDEKNDCERVGKFARENGLFGITFDAELCLIDGYVLKMLESGVPLYVHTVEARDAQRYYDMGISGIYTDG